MGEGDSYIIRCNLSILPIYLFIYLRITTRDNWDKILHVKLESIGDNYKIITFRITIFLCLAIFFSFCAKLFGQLE